MSSNCNFTDEEIEALIAACRGASEEIGASNPEDNSDDTRRIDVLQAINDKLVRARRRKESSP